MALFLHKIQIPGCLMVLKQQDTSHVRYLSCCNVSSLFQIEAKKRPSFPEIVESMEKIQRNLNNELLSQKEREKKGVYMSTMLSKIYINSCFRSLNNFKQTSLLSKLIWWKPHSSVELTQWHVIHQCFHLRKVIWGVSGFWSYLMFR